MSTPSSTDRRGAALLDVASLLPPSQIKREQSHLEASNRIMNVPIVPSSNDDVLGDDGLEPLDLTLGLDDDYLLMDAATELEETFVGSRADFDYLESIKQDPDINHGDGLEKKAPALCQVDETALEAEIAQELNKLSSKERNDFLYDFHGVAEFEAKTPQEIQASLKELDLCLSKEKETPQGEAYALAEAQSPDYVQQESFRLHFLKSKQFHIRDTCALILQHFTLKKELFGEEKLAKNITLKDLDKDDIACLSNGHFQMLPVLDTAGRHVMVNLLQHLKFKSTENLCRATWYFGMSLIDTKKRGARKATGSVAIIYNVMDKQTQDSSIPWALRRVRKSLPFRVGSMHLCTQYRSDSSKASTLVASLLDWTRSVCLEMALRVRTRTHRGTQQEIMESLEQYGIPVEVFPMMNDGAILRGRHRAWVDSRKLLEAAQEHAATQQEKGDCDDPSAASSLTETFGFLAPSQSDVLLGRGKASQTHIGNLRLRLMMETSLIDYESTFEHGGKMMLSKEIVGKVLGSGGLFVKFQQGLWRPVPFEEACQKVAHDFRTLRKSPLIHRRRPGSGDNESGTSVTPPKKRRGKRMKAT